MTTKPIAPMFLNTTGGHDSFVEVTAFGDATRRYAGAAPYITGLPSHPAVLPPPARVEGLTSHIVPTITPQQLKQWGAADLLPAERVAPLSWYSIHGLAE